MSVAELSMKYDGTFGGHHDGPLDVRRELYSEGILSCVVLTCPTTSELITSLLIQRIWRIPILHPVGNDCSTQSLASSDYACNPQHALILRHTLRHRDALWSCFDDSFTAAAPRATAPVHILELFSSSRDRTCLLDVSEAAIIRSASKARCLAPVPL